MRFTIAIATAALVASAHATTVTVADSTFANSDWNHTIYQFGPYGGSGSTGQVGGGESGTGWMIQNSCGPSYSGAWNACTYLPFSYDPSAVGDPLTGLTMSIDTRYEDYLQAVAFIVEQGGYQWTVGYYINTPSWTTYSITPTAADFAQLSISSPLLPDFSTSGGPIRFGIGSANSSAGGYGYSTTGYYDNFVVTFVPAPAASLLMMGALPLQRRKR